MAFVTFNINFAIVTSNECYAHMIHITITYAHMIHITITYAHMIHITITRDGVMRYII